MKTINKIGSVPRRRRVRIQAVFIAACLGCLSIAASASTPILSFDFNETDTTSVKDSVNGLTGVIAGGAPTSITDTPSGQSGDRAIHFENGDYITVDDPSTKVQLNPDDPSFTVQAWVKFDGNPAGRQVLFFNNGPGGAISFSVNTDRTVFVTTLGILDASSQAAIPDDGKWHHIAVVHQNGVELRYYVDGVLGDTRPYTQGVIFTRTQTFFSLGSEATGGLQYIGSLDRLKLTSGILTPDQLDFKSASTPPKDSDNDGMPDDWEVQYGLNPNDPSDAAKDCNNNGLTNLQEYQLGLNPCDTTTPALLSATSTGTFDTVKITFSKDLDPTTATNLTNYTISPSLAVIAASYKSKVVTLTTAKQAPGATAYTVTVKGVKDVSRFEVPAASNTVTFFSYLMSRTGVLKFSYWGNIAGTSVDGLTSDPRYPTTPDLVGAVFSYNSRDFFPDDSHETYGATIEGYLTPTDSGSYDFFLRSDDSSQLWLSTDDTEANLVMVAEETGCCNSFLEPGAAQTTAAPIALVANKKYFTRVIYKEGGGGDYAQVAWRKTPDTTAAAALLPIPGKYLSSAVDLPSPAEGLLVSQTPAPNAKGVSPTPHVTIVHRDGVTPWTTTNVSLKFDGVAVTPTFTKDASVATIDYVETNLLSSQTTHTISLGYADPTGKPTTLDWSFVTYQYTGPTKDVIKGIGGLIVGKAQFTPDAGGHSAKAGDYAIDLGKSGGAWIDIKDVSFINDAAVKDVLSMALWVKKYDIAAGSAFWAQLSSVKTGTDLRGFQAHVPWSDDTIYFDTAGCCDGAVQRISANINTFDAYNAVGTDDYWTNWHHFVFTKKADQKNIYIDGKLFLNGSNTDALQPNFVELGLGTDGVPGADFMHALLDDFAVFSTEISAADAAKLAGGASPKDLTGETLVAYWDFNDAKSTAQPTLSVAKTTTGLSLTFTGTLQAATAVIGPWTDVSGATSPASIPLTGKQSFYRAKQ